ncbi:zinc-binding dehydrogenase [Actinoplanes bogorensis]|uniref:Zinc-binding dehydrogenase n=1 Tax=Paractinoplanes bogorensis TaxID=1610840 RepID=A0ABS5YQ34_9ACTN|nr:zinc-binding dehydrogenase [Actinoplanes bogorensis]MBU2665557.1 zinc-binding dehydrogenase [Actinoplanes bogorensis]
MTVVVRIHQHGGPPVLRVEQAEVGEPGRGQVRLRQQAVGVNFFDTMVRRGEVGFPLPAVLGVEGAGVVEAVGPGVTGFAVGDRAGYFFDPGAYAGERLIATASLIPLPDDISTEQAAAFLAGGLTAWMGLRALHRLEPSQTVLVQGASGGVGALLSRWAKALGATVIGVAGSPSKVDRVPAPALWSGDPDFAGKLRSIAPRGVDVAYDLVGQATFDQVTSAVRDGGRIVAIGAATGRPQGGTDLRRRGVEVLGGSTPQYVNASTVGAASAELFGAVRAGVFADLDLVRYPLADAERVHRDIQARALTGLPVLTVG